MRTAGACLLRGSYSLIFVVKIKVGYVLRNGFFSDINYLEDLFFFGRSSVPHRIKLLKILNNMCGKCIIMYIL